MKFRSCSTEPCPRDRRDFREEQCARYDGRHFNINGLSATVRWVPKYSGSEYGPAPVTGETLNPAPVTGETLNPAPNINQANTDPSPYINQGNTDSIGLSPRLFLEMLNCVSPEPACL